MKCGPPTYVEEPHSPRDRNAEAPEFITVSHGNYDS